MASDELHASRPERQPWAAERQRARDELDAAVLDAVRKHGPINLRDLTDAVPAKAFERTVRSRGSVPGTDRRKRLEAALRRLIDRHTIEVEQRQRMQRRRRRVKPAAPSQRSTVRFFKVRA